MKVTLRELEDFANRFVEELPNTLGHRAHVVGLKGELGAGKTTFSQLVAKALGVIEPVQSPTFVIAKTYIITHPVFRRFVHVDAYRMSKNDPDTIGFTALLSDPANLIFVEWPENLGVFPADVAQIKFEVVSDDARHISYA